MCAWEVGVCMGRGCVHGRGFVHGRGVCAWEGGVCMALGSLREIGGGGGTIAPMPGAKIQTHEVLTVL